MIQYRGSDKIVFRHNAYKSKIKRGMAKQRLVLNLKKRCLCFSKQINTGNKNLKKKNISFVKMFLYLSRSLLIDFIVFIKQKCIKTSCFLYKQLIKKNQRLYKNTSIFIKNNTCVFLPQQVFKHQQK